MVLKSFKLRLYPNLEQSSKLNKTLGCTRLVYNYFLDYKINLYKNTGTSINYKDCSKLSTQLKLERPFLKEVDKFSMQNALKGLHSAYDHFFKDGFGFPKFKSKRNPKNSYTTNFTNNNIKIENHHIQLPKVGKVKYKGYKNKNISEYKIVRATISKNNLNQYFCFVTCEVEVQSMPKLATSVGIDFGIKTFATLSNSGSIFNPRTLFVYEHKLKQEQRKLSKKQKGSKNNEKQRLKLAKIHNKVANIREDFLQKETTKIIKENQIINIEKLSVKMMMTSKEYKNIAKELANVSINKAIQMLKYKADWYKRTLVEIGEYYPSSQLCHCCGYQNKELKLSDREWICPSCNTHLDRDYNASINILKEGQRILATRK